MYSKETLNYFIHRDLMCDLSLFLSALWLITIIPATCAS